MKIPSKLKDNLTMIISIGGFILSFDLCLSDFFWSKTIGYVGLSANVWMIFNRISFLEETLDNYSDLIFKQTNLLTCILKDLNNKQEEK